MSLMKIFLAPFLVKKSPIFKQCLCTCHVSYAENFANYNKSFTIDGRNEDKLTAESDALINMKDNKQLINGTHLFRKLKKLYKSKRYYQEDVHGIWDNANVKEICSEIDLNVDKLSVSESAKLLDLFGKMKAPGSMKVVQSLCKHINDSINDLTLLDFPNVSLALKQMPDTSLAKNLHSNLERKFIIKVATEYDPKNINHLQSALYFTACSMDNNKLLTLFINDLNNYKGKIPKESAISIFRSLSLMKQHPTGWFDLLQRIQNVFIEQIHDLDTDEGHFIVFLIRQNCGWKLKNEEFYNEMLCDLLVKKIVEDDSGFETAISTLHNLVPIRHVNRCLLNYVCGTFFEKVNLSNEVIQRDIFKLANLITSLSVVKHKSVFFNEIKDHLLNNKSLLLDYNDRMLCTLTLRLINLDCYPAELLTKVFDIMDNYKDEEMFLPITFCKIYQKLKTNPMYKGPLPSGSQMIALKKCHNKWYLYTKKQNNDRTLCYLEEGMGAPIYVKSNISSKLFHVIDYAVAFNKDGSPIPINTATNIDGTSDSIEFIEDLNVPPGSQIVLILLMPDFCYTRNTKELDSFYSCAGETLEALSYPVVYINKRTLDETPDGEKIAMLMSQIRSKLVHD